MFTISVGQALLLGLFSYFSNGGLVYLAMWELSLCKSLLWPL